MTGVVARVGLTIGGVGLSLLALTTAGLDALTVPTLTPTPVATADIPAAYLSLYMQAAQRCPMPWTILAAVGQVESDQGRDTATSSAGAVGPMQFEPATWARWGMDGDGDGRKDPRDPADAIPAAADYLCALGVTRNPHNALIDYNCGNSGPACQAASAGYAARVLAIAARYATTPTGSPVAALAVHAALAQVGTPYLWGGTTTRGFDCSGLVQYAYAQAGLALPRTAQEQYDATPHLPAGTPLQAGDLVFFGTGPDAIVHVGLDLGDGRMVDAPHTGADVRIEPDDITSADYVGATRPTAPDTAA